MRPYTGAAVFLMALAVVISSCEKPEESVGIDLQPEEDIFGVGYADTLSIDPKTMREDSLRSDNVSPALVGAYMDPVFGLSKATHNTEIRLTSTNPNFVGAEATIDQIIVDSLILSLWYAYPAEIVGLAPVPFPIYGGTGAQYFQVFELNENLSYDSVYYANRIADIIPEDLVEEGKNLIAPNPTDSIVIGGVKQPARLRIPLKHSLAERIITASADDGLTAEEFLDLVKGLQITVDENAAGVDLSNTGIISFEALTAQSVLSMYYRDLATEDTLYYNFALRSLTGKYNYFQHDYTSAENSLYQQAVNEDYSSAGEVVYLQAMNGVKIEVNFPSLTALRDSVGLAVSRAELVLPVSDEAVNSGFAPPGGLFIFGIDEEGRSYLLDDRPITGGFNGAVYDTDKKEYRFVIPRYIQQVISGDREHYGLEIVSEKASFSPRRIILNGPDHPNRPMKLNLTFTKY